MICQLGMSKKLGPLTYGKRQRLAYLNIEGTEERNFSEDTARLIDGEVKELVEEGQSRAREILTQKRLTLDALARLLQEKEVVSGEEIKEVIRASEAQAG
jgi:cell division protease FtsH